MTNNDWWKFKGLWVDFGGFRDGDAFQIEAIVEGLIFDFFQLRALREDDLAETVTVLESVLPNGLHARRYLYFLEASPRERFISDLSQLIR